MTLTLVLRFSLPELDISRHVTDDHPAGQGVHVTCHFPDLRTLLEHGRQRTVVLIVVLGRLDTILVMKMTAYLAVLQHS
jgi:hypothetical protein